MMHYLNGPALKKPGRTRPDVQVLHLKEEPESWSWGWPSYAQAIPFSEDKEETEGSFRKRLFEAVESFEKNWRIPEDLLYQIFLIRRENGSHQIVPVRSPFTKEDLLTVKVDGKIQQLPAWRQTITSNIRKNMGKEPLSLDKEAPYLDEDSSVLFALQNMMDKGLVSLQRARELLTGGMTDEIRESITSQNWEEGNTPPEWTKSNHSSNSQRSGHIRIKEDASTKAPPTTEDYYFVQGPSEYFYRSSEGRVQQVLCTTVQVRKGPNAPHAPVARLQSEHAVGWEYTQPSLTNEAIFSKMDSIGADPSQKRVLFIEIEGREHPYLAIASADRSLSEILYVQVEGSRAQLRENVEENGFQRITGSFDHVRHQQQDSGTLYVHAEHPDCLYLRTTKGDFKLVTVEDLPGNEWIGTQTEYEDLFGNKPQKAVVRTAKTSGQAMLSGAQLAGANRLNQLLSQAVRRALTEMGMSEALTNTQLFDKALKTLGPLMLHFACEHFGEAIPGAPTLKKGSEMAMQASTFEVLMPLFNRLVPEMTALRSAAEEFTQVYPTALPEARQKDVVQETVEYDKTRDLQPEKT